MWSSNPYRHKPLEKQRAIALRKQGLSYNAIRKHVDVSKSTLSLWLRSVGLAMAQKQRITARRRFVTKLGQIAVRRKRVKRTKMITEVAAQEVGEISVRELWLIGIALYWAEGSKQKTHDVSGQVSFANTDPQMVRVFISWLLTCCRVSMNDIVCRIHIHETADSLEAKAYWKQVIRVPIPFLKTIFKRHRPLTNRKNRFYHYHGLLRINVRKSTDFNRKITGWIQGVLRSKKV